MSVSGYTPAQGCRSCGADLREVFDLGMHYPVCFPSRLTEEATLYPLCLMICDNPACGLVQLSGTVDPALLFKKHYWYRSGINESMRAALADITKQAMARRPLQEDDWVVDIGANDGTLLATYPEGVLRCAVEPAPNVRLDLQKHCDVLIPDFFPQPHLTSDIAGKVKIVTAIAMAYDLPAPHAFFGGVADLLAPDGLFVCQLGYIGDLLRANAFDSICAEHVEYYSLTSLAYLLQHAGLVVEDVEWNPVNGGSIRCYIRHARCGAQPSARVVKLLADEEAAKMHTAAAYKGLELRARQMREQVCDRLRELGGEAYVYGASTKGLTTMQYLGLDSQTIQAAVERDAEKWGRWYGKTGVQIIPEETWREAPARLTLVLPWHFRDGMVEREQAWLRKGGRFLFPMPAVEEVGGGGQK